ncbi:MAG: plasmid stability protein stbC [Geminicoccaceae bacterium]
MPSVTIRNVPEEVHRALKVRAALHGRSTEAEMRDILELAVRPGERIRLGSLLADIGREVRLTDREHGGFEQVRDKSPARAAELE